MTLDEVKDALNKFFSDKSRSQADTLDGLEDLEGEIDTLKDALREDMREADR